MNMRLNVTILGLVAFWLEVVQGQAQGENGMPLPSRAMASAKMTTTCPTTLSYVTIAPLHADTNIITPTSGTVPNQTISWTASSTVTIKAACLMKRNGTSNLGTARSSAKYAASIPAAATMTRDSLTYSGDDETDSDAVGSSKRRIDDNSDLGTFESSNQGDTSYGSLVLPYNSWFKKPQLSKQLEMFSTPLYIQLEWETGSESGRSYSPVFAVVKEVSIEESLSSEMPQAPDGLTRPAKPEEFLANSIKSTTSAIAFPASTSSTNSANPTSTGSESSTLSTGAIVAIAVGCGVAALLIIGGLVWFCCFRRRRNNDHVVHSNFAYASDSGIHVLPDKEVPPNVDESPHSAYGDDGRRLHDRSSMVASGNEPGHEHDSEIEPYSDRAQTPSAAPAVMTGANSQTNLSLPASVRSPTPPRYAHLVEEGMTDEEIRRLEEEERQLDAAIEDAGRNSRVM